MQNLRINTVKVIDSTSIQVTFTENLTPNLSTSNISIISDSENTPSSDVLKIRIQGSTLSIACQPLTPYGVYYLYFKSTSSHTFISLNGDAILLENDVANKYMILGPIPDDDPFKQSILNYLSDNIYNISDTNSVVSQYIHSLSTNFAKAFYDIGAVKNENYLSIFVKDEKKTRGEGPFDRLFEGGAYELLRVGRTISNTITSMLFSFDNFINYPVTLQKQEIRETLHIDSVDEIGIFNVNNFVLNLSQNPVTKLISVVFTIESSTGIYIYNIPTLGYLIKDSRYDKDYASTYHQLNDNQIKLNNKILQDPLFDIENILKIDVIYEYKDLGRIIESNSVNVYTAENIIRETLPPIINVFNLKHAPIINNDNTIPTLNGIVFQDPNNNIPGAKHPAFLYEIPYRINALPSSIGQYSIDYSSGTVYVFGADKSNNGTGAYPPLASYKYRHVYQSEIDYTYYSDISEIVALPKGSLVGYQGNIYFTYEQVLIPNVDYKSALHNEELKERAENRLIALNVVKTKNPSITNVFRVYNETSGEIYTISRWNDNKIYFNYLNAPRIEEQLAERVSFKNIVNEMLFINETLTNVHGLRIFKILLDNNTLIAVSEDSIANAFNTSLVFTDSVFLTERWFSRFVDTSTNINKLKNIGEYIVDYTNGIVYCAVSNTQSNNIGFVTYKNNNIIPNFPHILTVQDLYCQIGSLDIKNKIFNYLSFDDNVIIPDTLDYSDELFLNNSSTAPYILYNNRIGTFIDSTFRPGISNQIKFLRSVFELDDLSNSTNPLNFTNYSSYYEFYITVGSINKQCFDNIKYDIDGYYVNFNENIPYLSPNISYNFETIRTSDSTILNNTIIAGNPVKLIITGSSLNIGDLVVINSTFTINNLSSIMVDYNKGDFFTDYSYLADELILSYEYGENLLDFRASNALSPGEEYFVSYKAGALRDALYANFGNLINIPELTTFNIDFDRERYREALMAALSSFIKGPTVEAIKNIGKIITHITPEVIESLFQGWSLGNSILNPQLITTTGSFQLLPAKFESGALIDSNQTIKFPINSNIKLEEGTFETWIIPKWNGLDNDAELTFNILQDGYNIESNQVFVGAAEQHPSITNGSFSLNKNSYIIGTPNKNKDGVFIYYDKDISGSFYNWYLEIIDGYVESISSNYKIKITSSGTFYNVKSLVLPKPSNMTLFTGVNLVSLNITGGTSGIDQGISFISDISHYLLDLGKDNSRMSLFKDVSGYLNFQVIDKNKATYIVSADVSSWRIDDIHHIAISWKLNTINNRDEMHLFIDGFEVPNIIKYGQKLQPYLHEKFRTINLEEILGLSDRNILASTDLSITSGSDIVSSLINFSAYNIFAGDQIFIDEVGFNTTGYTIITVNGQLLQLDQTMPLTLSNGRFSVNRTNYSVLSDIDTASNIQVSTIHTLVSANDLSGSIGTNIVTSSSINFETFNVIPGYLIRIEDNNLPITYSIVQVDGYSVYITDNLPINISNASFHVYSNVENEIPGMRAFRPSYSISKDGYFNNILTISNSVEANDLILIRTLGLNHRRIKKQYYVWSDNKENILMTRLPPPISLDEVKIIKVILPIVSVGPLNSTLISGVFHSNNLITNIRTSNSQNGRTIGVTISGTNVDFSTPVQVIINGLVDVYTVNETLTFTDYGTLYFTNLYLAVNYIKVIAKPINSLKNALTIEAKEKFSITYSESSGLVPVVKYSYQIGSGYTLFSNGDGYVSDGYHYFSDLHINNYLIIHKPIIAAGFYKILGLSEDKMSLFIEATTAAPYPPSPIPIFTNGMYQILNVNEYRSGLQNGFFTFEVSKLPSIGYLLSHGFYELDYSSYLSIKLDLPNDYVYLGSDHNSLNQINAIIDQVKIYSTMLTDTRVGEIISYNQRSITKDYNSLKALSKDSDTLMLLDFNSFPFTNSSDFYINSYKDKQYFHSSIKVNENFTDSLAILYEPMILSNDGILSKKEGTIEFWTYPLYDTANDPVVRFYFDASSAVIEEAISVNNVSVKIPSFASKILSVTLKDGDPNIDYFVGGKLEIDTQRAIIENHISISNNSVKVDKLILQVITVKIVGDFSGTDYFANGSINNDNKTIYLGKLLPASGMNLIVTYQTLENQNIKLNTQVIRLNKKLPAQNSHVIVKYLPSGVQGDRIAIYKDNFGYINFGITASGTDYLVRAPTRWAKNTWHRIKVSYRINNGNDNDALNLFLDGYEYSGSSVLFGTGLIYGAFPTVMGSSRVGGIVGYKSINNIIFKDTINTLYVGSQYTKENRLFGLINNLRISNVFRPIYIPYNESIDVNYNSNLNVVFPVTKDLFTTYLQDSSNLVVRNEDFTTIVNKNTGAFNFSVNIFDCFGIVDNGGIKVKQVLEKLITILKSATSKVTINYIK
jgi:hypothetical protein